MKAWFSKLTACVFLVTLLFVTLTPVLAEEATSEASESPSPTPEPTPDNDAEIAEKQKKIEELQQKLGEINGKKTSLTNTIQYINTKISIGQAQIDKTQAEINTLEHQMEDLDTRIGGLEESLTILSDVLLTRINQQYKQKQTNPVHLLLISDGLNEFITRYRYTEIAQDYTKEVMSKAESQKLTFDEQKKLKAEKQEEIEGKRQVLESQKQQLAVERGSQQQLLNTTKNDETRYQQLLAQAEAELSSLRSFSSSKGGGLVSAQNSPDGWYYSQRDERWGNNCIGMTCSRGNPDTIWEVGCLISSIAMVKKKYGENITPADIARNSQYYVWGTASMLYPADGGWPSPAGYYWQYPLYASTATIDHELAEGRPVIIKLRVSSNSVGTHFLVLKSGSGGNYVMHDPWEGYDKNFTDYYSFGQIIQIGILKK